MDFEQYDNAFKRPTGLLPPKRVKPLKFDPPSFDISKYTNKFNRPTGFGRAEDRPTRTERTEVKKTEVEEAEPATQTYENSFNRPTGLGRPDPPAEKPRAPPAAEEQSGFGSYKRSEGLRAFTAKTPVTTSDDASSDDSTGGW